LNEDTELNLLLRRFDILKKKYIGKFKETGYHDLLYKQFGTKGQLSVDDLKKITGIMAKELGEPEEEKPVAPPNLARFLSVLDKMAQHYERSRTHLQNAISRLKADARLYPKYLGWIKTVAIPSLEKRVEYSEGEADLAQEFLDELRSILVGEKGMRLAASRILGGEDPKRVLIEELLVEQRPTITINGELWFQDEKDATELAQRHADNTGEPVGVYWHPGGGWAYQMLGQGVAPRKGTELHHVCYCRRTESVDAELKKLSPGYYAVITVGDEENLNPTRVIAVRRDYDSAMEAIRRAVQYGGQKVVRLVQMTRAGLQYISFLYPEVENG